MSPFINVIDVLKTPFYADALSVLTPIFYNKIETHTVYTRNVGTPKQKWNAPNETCPCNYAIQIYYAH